MLAAGALQAFTIVENDPGKVVSVITHVMFIYVYIQPTIFIPETLILYKCPTNVLV